MINRKQIPRLKCIIVHINLSRIKKYRVIGCVSTVNFKSGRIHIAVYLCFIWCKGARDVSPTSFRGLIYRGTDHTCAVTTALPTRSAGSVAPTKMGYQKL